jgi:DNA-binding LacI/PurR family transcriptional regulator
MERLKSLKVTRSRSGHPLYLTVRDTLREAIESGVFQPGQRMPSTKQLSQYMEVSLVTAHRALQELVGSGVLQRSQGRGTFVHEHFRDRLRAGGVVRVGVILHSGVSIADFRYGQIIEGIRAAAAGISADLVLLRLGEDIRNECSGYLLVGPTTEQLRGVLAASRRRPIVAIDSDAAVNERLGSVQMDHFAMALQAVAHLAGLGHRSIGYVGPDEEHVPNGRERWNGFVAACLKHDIDLQSQHILRVPSWQLDERELMALMRMLSVPERPSAVFAAGYGFVMDLYQAAAASGVNIPSQVSLVGVDDPPSAPYLAPPLTTLRQPLVELGRSAMQMLVELIDHPQSPGRKQLLAAELVVRQSTAPAAVLK